MVDAYKRWAFKTKNNLPNKLDMSNESIDFMDKLFMMYKAGWKPDKEGAFKMYQYLKGIGLMEKLPVKKVEEARMLAGNNKDNAWMFELKAFLDLMVRHNYTFKQWVK